MDDTDVSISLKGNELVHFFKLNRGEVFQYLAAPPKPLSHIGMSDKAYIYVVTEVFFKGKIPKTIEKHDVWS